MKLTFCKGRSNTNQHGTEKEGELWNRETVRGWTFRVVKLETFRRLSTNTEAVQTLVGRRLLIYKPSGAWWYFDVYLLPTIKECEPWPRKGEEGETNG